MIMLLMIEGTKERHSSWSDSPVVHETRRESQAGQESPGDGLDAPLSLRKTMRLNDKRRNFSGTPYQDYPGRNGVCRKERLPLHIEDSLRTGRHTTIVYRVPGRTLAEHGPPGARLRSRNEQASFPLFHHDKPTNRSVWKLHAPKRDPDALEICGKK